MAISHLISAVTWFEPRITSALHINLIWLDSVYLFHISTRSFTLFFSSPSVVFAGIFEHLAFNCFCTQPSQATFTTSIGAVCSHLVKWNHSPRFSFICLDFLLQTLKIVETLLLYGYDWGTLKMGLPTNYHLLEFSSVNSTDSNANRTCALE